MIPTAAGLGVDWLGLREPADARARSTELVERLVRHTPVRPWVVHDLGAGTGAMARWLAPQVPGAAQEWVLHDRDVDLLATGLADLPTDSSGNPVTIRARHGELTELTVADLTGATLITASALLDLLTGDELDHMVGLCAAVAAPVLVTTSVTGRVALSPADPLDEPLRRAFNDHQRRGGRLGPDATARATATLSALGYQVITRPTPWRLGPVEARLAEAWLGGWVHAAGEQRPGLRSQLPEYVRRRSTQLAAGELTVTVHHRDLLAVPGER